MDDHSNNLNLADISNQDEEHRKELEKTKPENLDQQGFFGSESDPELATEKDTLEEAQEMGLYTQGDQEHPVPLGEQSPKKYPD